MYKTMADVEELMIDIARITLGLSDADRGLIRAPYGASSKTGSAPAHNPNRIACYVHVSPTDDGYGQQHHLSYMDSAEIGGDMTEVDEYTEEYAVNFSCYGEGSFERARLIRDGLYGNAIKRMLGKEQIYLKTGIPAIVQTHDILNTTWVMRCDVTATFYSYVRIERGNTVPPIEHAGITIKTENKTYHYTDDCQKLDPITRDDGAGD